MARDERAAPSARPAARWRPQIAAILENHWPSFSSVAAVDWIEAQVEQESGGNPLAKSPVGARGLLQLMPLTAGELGVTDSFDPAQNLLAGIRYLRAQYDQLSEVPDHLERLFWSFAAYNGGRGYIDFNGGPMNTALELAKERGERLKVEWWRWDFGKVDLARVQFKGRRPDWHQMVDYVDRIRKRFALIQAAA